MMFLMVGLVALAVATLAVVAIPLLRPAQAIADRGQFDRAVYRDQLKELERDVARGVLSPAEAQSARLEVQRRLLAAEGRSGAGWIGAGPSLWLAAGISGFVLIASAALYFELGSPGLLDMPFASRGTTQPTMAGDPGHLDVDNAAEKLRLKLQADPKDAEGWLLYARTESMLSHWNRARDAYNRAMALGQNGPNVLAGFGEMLVLGEQGIVSPAARDVFGQALKADPKNPVARYYVALGNAQAGEVKRAISEWMGLAADSPSDSPIRRAIAQRIAEAAQSGGIAVPSLPQGRPPQTAAVSRPGEAPSAGTPPIPEAQRRQINSMVAQLAAKLKIQPNDLDGWLRLGRSYLVLGDKEKAADAYQQATALKPEDVTIKLREVEALLTGLAASDPLPSRAVAVLRDVEKQSPNQPEALWYLGIAAARTGQTTVARDDWTRLLKVLPTNGPDAKMVTAALQQVKGP